MSEFSVAGARAVVVGGARSGIAAAELLASKGARVTLTDTKSSLEDEERLRTAGVSLELGEHRPDTLRRADLVVVSPGVPWRQPVLEAARAAGVPIIGELELASRWLKGRIVAITGTKGKSTTTALTGRMLEDGGIRTLVGGNIGSAVSAQVAATAPDVVHVIEVSSFQLEQTVTFRPWIAVFLNFSPDHLDRHASLNEYAEAKRRIFVNQEPEDWAVINADDPAVLALARAARARTLRFALHAAIDEGVAVAGGVIVSKRSAEERPLVPLSSVRLIGRHLLSDVLAATAVADVVGVDPGAMRHAVESFTGLEHALEPVAEISGVRFVNDSKATNIEAARRAIESFDDRLVVILGGRFKGGDFAVLGDPLVARRAAVVSIGESRSIVHDALGEAVPVHEAASMRDAVRRAFDLLPEGGTVVLAPACASFDMFRDYAERGRVFKDEVRRLADEVGGHV
jgi:UDP-N-acetylmuramoylalanine--D-glutamate ligase